MGSTHDALQPLADAIAERVWARIQDRLAERDAKAHLIGITDAAARIGVGKTKMYAMLSTGEIPEKLTRRIGRRVLIVAAELERWAAAQ